MTADGDHDHAADKPWAFPRPGLFAFGQAVATFRFKRYVQRNFQR
jgi:hypothetical protein